MKTIELHWKYDFVAFKSKELPILKKNTIRKPAGPIFFLENFVAATTERSKY